MAGTEAVDLVKDPGDQVDLSITATTTGASEPANDQRDAGDSAYSLGLQGRGVDRRW